MINKKFKKLTSLMLTSSLLTPNLLVKADTNNISNTVSNNVGNNVNRLDESDLFIEDNDNVSVDDRYDNLINGSNISTYDDDSNVDTPPNDVPSQDTEDLEKVATVLENKWDKSYTGALSSKASVKTIATTDGGYMVVICDNGRLSFNKFTKSGKLDWKKEHAVPYLGITDIDYVSDGAFVVTGFANSNQPNDSIDENQLTEHDSSQNNSIVSVISKYDLNGALLWSESYEENDEIHFNNTEVLIDGSIVSVGYTLKNNLKYPTIYRIDVDGEIMWNNTIDSSTGEYIDLVVKDDNLIVGFNGEGDLFGSTPYGGSDVIIVNYNMYGDTGEFKLLGGKNDEILKSMDLTKDGNILLMGTFKSSDVFGGFATDTKHTEMVLELDSSYEPVWGYSVGYNLKEMLVSIDGTLVLSGNGTSAILNRNTAYIESVKKGFEPTVLDFRFSGAKNDYYYSTITQLVDNNVVLGSLITESKNSYVNVRSVSLGLEAEDFRSIVMSATLKDGSIIDAVNSLDKKYIVLRLNKEGAYTDLKSFEGATVKSLTANEDGGFSLIYVSKDSKTVKSSYDANGSLVDEVLITDSNVNQKPGSSNNGNNSNNGNVNQKPDSSNNGNSSDSDNNTSNDDNSNQTPNGDGDDNNQNQTPSDNTNGGLVLNGSGNLSNGDSSNGASSTGGTTNSPNGTTNNSDVGLSEVKNHKETLPYTGIEGSDILLILGAVTLIGGSLFMYMNNKYYSKKYL